MQFGFCGEYLTLTTSQYHNGGLAVRAATVGGEPFAVLSIWLSNSPNLPADVFYLKEWSENEKITAAAIAQGVIVPAPEFPAQVSGMIANIRAFRLASAPQVAPVKTLPEAEFLAEAREAMGNMLLADTVGMSDADFADLLFGPDD